MRSLACHCSVGSCWKYHRWVYKYVVFNLSKLRKRGRGALAVTGSILMAGRASFSTKIIYLNSFCPGFVIEFKKALPISRMIARWALVIAVTRSSPATFCKLGKHVYLRTNVNICGLSHRKQSLLAYILLYANCRINGKTLFDGVRTWFCLYAVIVIAFNCIKDLITWSNEKNYTRTGENSRNCSLKRKNCFAMDLIRHRKYYLEALISRFPMMLWFLIDAVIIFLLLAW